MDNWFKKLQKLFSQINVVTKNLANGSTKVKRGTKTKKNEDQATMPELEDQQAFVIKFSLNNVAKVTLVIVAILALIGAGYIVRETLLLLFVAFLLSSGLLPTIDWLAERKIPRGLSVVFVYFLSITVLVLFFSSFLPILGQELVALGKNIHTVVLKIGRGELTIPGLDFALEPLQQYLATQDLNDFVEYFQSGLVQIGTRLAAFTGSAVKVLSAFSNGVLNFVVVLVLAFFLIVDRDAVNRFVVTLFPKRYEGYILNKNKEIQKKIGFWMQGQLVLMFVIAVITYLGLLILGVEYALTLAFLAGLAEVLPVVGPLVAMLVSIPIVANQAGWLIIAVPILFIIIQQIENNVLVPMIMKKAVGLSPVFVILSMLIGYKFLGILGMILSVPVATMVSLFVDDYRSHRS